MDPVPKKTRVGFSEDFRRYFVRGLAGAQFATAAAVDALRDAASDAESPAVAMSTTDPANAYALPLPVDTEGARVELG